MDIEKATKDLQLLQASIEHWRQNKDGETCLVASSHCALCEQYIRKSHSHDCTGCPIAEATGRKGCYGTPYYKAAARSTSSPSAFRAAAKAEHDYLVGLYNALKIQLRNHLEASKQPAFPVTIQAPALKPGEKFAGVILSADGSRRHALILLPGKSEDANWKKANEWAASQGGELPDRVEGALLFATLKDEFKPEAYWTREQHAGNDDYAWYQDFNLGLQNNNHKLNQLRARAVKRIPL